MNALSEAVAVWGDVATVLPSHNFDQRHTVRTKSPTNWPARRTRREVHTACSDGLRLHEPLVVVDAFERRRVRDGAGGGGADGVGGRGKLYCGLVGLISS